VKRFLDVVGSALGLIALSPVLGVAAIWIALDSPGPVLFRQRRVGKHGRIFEILKFRTMRVQSGIGRRITVGDDPRITRSGRLLRRLKVDELPQLFNVLCGDMSLVGPRPELESYVKMYPAEAREQIMSVRPGITGLASLAFRNESELLASASDPEHAYVETVLPAKLRYDLSYIDRQTVMLDLSIMVRTVRAVLSGAGADSLNPVTPQRSEQEKTTVRNRVG
jgi:lipopolysaccharide/colanic/teichoic acid biosynthesis glycosyltransferase